MSVSFDIAVLKIQCLFWRIGEGGIQWNEFKVSTSMSYKNENSY